MAVLPAHAQPLPLTVVPTGAAWIRQGDPGRGAMRIERGIGFATAVSAIGWERIVEVLGPGDPVGAPPGARSPWTLRAVTPIRLRPVAPNEAFRLHAALVERVVRTVVELSGLDVAERIERRLGELADRLGRPSPHGRTVPFRLTQEELAALVGTSRESANRAVRALAARGAIVVVGRGRYAVADELLDGVRP